jgi:hypothetical protein
MCPYPWHIVDQRLLLVGNGQPLDELAGAILALYLRP